MHTAKIAWANEVIIVQPEEFGKTAARRVAELIRGLQQDLAREVTIVFATGNTMVEFLHSLAKEEGIDWARIQAFHLDEYLGLPPEHESSFAFFLDLHLFSRVPIPRRNIHFIAAYRDIYSYMADLEGHGGPDVVILGVGNNGHWAFNEPPDYSNGENRMRTVRLTPETIEANAPDYPGIRENPLAITMGPGDILEGLNLFFLVNGEKKAKIVWKSLMGKISPNVPASFLQKHQNVRIVLDEGAASLLMDRVVFEGDPCPICEDGKMAFISTDGPYKSTLGGKFVNIEKFGCNKCDFTTQYEDPLEG